MPITTMPALDQTVAGQWTENQIDLYNALPYYFADVQVKKMKTRPLWSKMVGTRKWKPKNGDTMKAIRTEPSPHIRQFANPEPLSGRAKKDVMNVREVTVDAQVYKHKFESPNLYFFPDFNDFMDHVDDTANDITEKIARYNDLFIRSRIFHMAPYMFVCKANGDVALINTPFWTGTGAFVDGTHGKTATWLQDTLSPLVTGPLAMSAAAKMSTIVENHLRIPYFSGSGAAADNTYLQGKYCLTLSAEAFNRFTFDEYVKTNKNINMDIVNESFRGLLFGRTTTRIEDMPLRMKADGTFAAPEIRVEDAAAYNDGETLPHPDYTTIATSPIEFGFWCGDQGYEAIEVGPPPSKFTGNTPPHDFPALFWNGEVKATKQFLVDTIDDSTGETVKETNMYGEWLRLISQTTHGILPKQRRNIIPVAYLRDLGV